MPQRPLAGAPTLRPLFGKGNEGVVAVLYEAAFTHRSCPGTPPLADMASPERGRYNLPA